MNQRFLVIQLLGRVACAVLHAQPRFGARADTDPPVSLGLSVLSLNGPWKFHIGDSPIDQKTGMPLWAEPDFDDSAWEPVDLTPASGTVDPYTGQPGWVPGWTTRGHPGQWGFGWYRIWVHLNLWPGEELAVIGPTDLDDGYQMFGNGKLAGNLGDFTRDPPVTGLPLPMLFPLPQLAGGGAAPATQVLAFRFWMHPGTLASEPDVGGFHVAPVLGEANAAREIYRMHWVNLVQANAAQVFAALAFAVLALMAFSLILFDHSDLLYAWMGTVSLLRAGAFALSCLYSWTPMSGLTFNLSFAVLDGLVSFGWVMVWWIWFGRQRPSWLPVAVAALAVVHEIAATIALEQFFTVIPHSVA